MDTQDTQNDSSPQQPSDQQQQVAVPYVPPPPPQETKQSSRSPMVNTMIIIAVIAVGSIMAFNFVGHGLTQTAGQSIDKSTYDASPTPSTSPTPVNNDAQ